MILLLGYGISNKAVKKYLDKNNILYKIHDDKKDVIKEEILKDVDLIIKSPGINNSHPLIFLALLKDIEVINEIEFAYRKNNTGIIIGITSSNGKTTTQYILYQLLKLGFDDVYMVGNNGVPYIDIIDKINESSIIILELSSFQLMDIKSLRLDFAILMNITPNHLDFHQDFKEYKDAKLRLFLNNDEFTTTIIDDKCYFSIIKGYIYKVSDKKINGYYINDEFIYYKNKKELDLSLLKLVGRHNKMNFLYAYIVAKNLGISKSKIIDNLDNIKGVKYRLEYLKSIGKIDIFNDGKSSTPEAVKYAIDSFKNRKLHVIIGGKDKGSDYSILNNLDNVIFYCYGENKHKLESLKNRYFFDNLQQAYKAIKAKGHDVIIYSPGASSFDQYKNYQERAKEFERLVLDE